MRDLDHFEPDQPPEPDWDELLRALEDAETWLLSENGLDEEACMIRVEAIYLVWAMTKGAKDGESVDALTREFFERVNTIAFWVQGNCEDEKLAEWVRRFCVDPAAEWERIRKIDAAADCKGEA